ncbi:amino acid ABC transporter substrate-binding protein [Thalassotalea sp. M1531]|uniref:Amino acid ABC transporter substrate-binding protein n=1 Tax=Thalassotalea algicola TaxID=2716224 RepID=A0A7Y0LAT7_9GAMM|nr:transporter substrate-binding domain-containing protein [Thalassotalea algicola]NMP31138.1 amino acid ABC transporter substrate-binding protein [Thalassotalea algicola]
MKIVMFVLLVLCASSSLAAKVHLTSLSWPPYSDEFIKNQGASVAVAKAAFAIEGHELIVSFFPWSRTVNLAKQQHSKYAGYFPEYFYETSEFLFSKPMGSGPLGLLQNKDEPINYSSVKDLIGKKVGVVQDYVNTKALDDLIANGDVKAEAVPSDVINIKKVAAKRVAVAVIDPYVFEHLLATDDSLVGVKHKVEMHKQLLEMKQLFVAFRNDEQGRKWQKVFNQGLAKIDVERIMSNYLAH